MTRFRRLAPLLALLGVAALGSAPARAQRETYSYLSYVGSDVSLVSHDEEDSSARANTPIVAGDRISTGRDSRAEAILADGTVIRFDGRTEARFDRLARTYQSDDDRTLLALTSGALAVETPGERDEEQAVRVDTQDATVVLPVRATVRVDAGRRGTEVYVLTGSVEVLGRAGRVTVRAGESAFVSGSEEIEVAESTLPHDRFTQFLEERRQRPRGESLRYLAQVRAVDDVDDASWDEDSYGAAYDASLLDDAGSWIYVPTYSRWCWRPHARTDWRPYSSGYWRYTPCGLTWVSYEPWGWMPYHYGSWFMDASFGWCWSPGWAYSPAWVYWNYTPSWVGWCPMGYYGGHDGWWGGGHSGHPGRFEWNRYAHLRGRVDVTRIDPRGWNYVQTTRMGGRFERGDVVRGDRVTFRPGETGVIATAPLRVERTAGVTLHAAVLEAVRRVPSQTVRGTDTDLTQILRRERTLPATAVETLRRSTTTVQRDAAYRPLRAEKIASERIEAVSREADRPAVRRDDVARTESWRGVRVEPRTERAERVEPRTEVRTQPQADEGWRATTRTDAGRFRRDDSGSRQAPRTEETPRSTETPRRDDSGWRAPAPRTEPAPRHESRETRSYEVPRAPEAPRPAPRVERHEARSFEAPRSEPSRAYEAPRPAPRSEPPRSYEAPRPMPRSERSRSFEAPRTAPEPRFAAPAPRFESHVTPPSPPVHRSSPATRERRP